MTEQAVRIIAHLSRANHTGAVTTKMSRAPTTTEREVQLTAQAVNQTSAPEHSTANRCRSCCVAHTHHCITGRMDWSNCYLVHATCQLQRARHAQHELLKKPRLPHMTYALHLRTHAHTPPQKHPPKKHTNTPWGPRNLPAFIPP